MQGFEIAGWQVVPDLNRLEREGTVVTLEPKVMDVLVRLARAGGDVVSKQTLFDDVWPGVHVSDDALVRAVGELRRALGDDATAPRIVETIRKRGYRLSVPVIWPTAPAPVPPPAPRRATRWAWPGGAALLGLAATVALSRGLTASHGSPPALRTLAPLALDGLAQEPALSPDGLSVVVAWRPEGSQELDLHLVPAAGGTPVPLAAGPGHERAPAWSADGARIAFALVRGPECRLKVAEVATGVVRDVTPCPDPEHLRTAWTADGQGLYVSARVGDAVALHRLDLDSLELRQLTAPPAGWHGDELPSLSPDGRALAFARFRTGRSGDVMIASADGSNPRPLTSDGGGPTGMAWLDGGASLVVSSDRAGLHALWSFPVGGGAPRLVAGGGSKIKHPSASRDGRLLACETWRYDIGLHEQPIGGGPSRRLVGGQDVWNYHPQLSPDGRWLAFGSNRGDGYALWVAARDGSQPRRLARFGGAFVATPRWSPDGRSLAFVAQPEGNADVYLVGLAGGAPRRLTDGEGEDVAPRFSADGRSVLFASRRSGRWETHAVDLASGALHGTGEVLETDPRPVAPPAGLAVEETRGGGLVRQDGHDLVLLADQAWPGIDVDWRARSVLYARADRREPAVLLLKQE